MDVEGPATNIGDLKIKLEEMKVASSEHMSLLCCGRVLENHEPLTSLEVHVAECSYLLMLSLNSSPGVICKPAGPEQGQEGRVSSAPH